jgi:hypothetical protein
LPERCLPALASLPGATPAHAARGWVTGGIGRLGRGHLHHELNDVARGAELAILFGAGNLAEHVFVDIALGVAVLRRHVPEQVHHPGQQRRCGDGEARILHVVRVGRVITAQSTQEREDVLTEPR